MCVRGRHWGYFFPVVAVVAPLNKSPQMLMWDPKSHPGVTTIAQLGAAGTHAIMHNPFQSADMEGALGDAWLHNAPREWTFTDEDGDPLRVTRDNIEARLTWTNGGFEVVEAANRLYAGDLLNPLVKRMPKPSRRGRTGISTSATPSSGSDPESPSSPKPSLRTVTGGKRSAAKAS